MTAALIGRSGRALDADAHIGYYGPGEVSYDDEGDYGIAYREGLLAEHAVNFVAAGGTIRKAASGSGLAWAILSDGRAVPVVCGEFIPITTEDGPSTGRCGLDATGEGQCEGHAAEYASWFAMTEVERAAWERDPEREW